MFWRPWPSERPLTPECSPSQTSLQAKRLLRERSPGRWWEERSSAVTAGAGSELGIAVQVAIVGSSGVVGGIAERGIKTGSLNEAMKNPGEMAKDFATTAAGYGVSKTVEALATTAERGAVQSLSAQQARATTAVPLPTFSIQAIGRA